MNLHKADVLDHFVSPKIICGPSASPASADAAVRLREDPGYAELKHRLDAIGFFRPAPGDYAWRIALAAAMAIAGWCCIVLASALWLRAIGVALIGITMIQSAFLAHDAAHGAIAKRAWLVELIGQLYATVIAGYAFSYFRRGHDLHHFHTNEEELDPDCLSDVFSVGAASVRRKVGIGRFFTRHQAVIVPIVLPLWALTLKWDGLTFLARSWRRWWRDLVALAVHVAVWLVIPAHVIGVWAALAAYLTFNGLAGLYLGVVIPVNHIGTAYPPPGHDLTFLEHQLATSRNIRRPTTPIVRTVFAYFFIGLDHQVEHHLFPWAPVCRLADGAAVTRAFCAERGLPYHEASWTRAARDIGSHLARIGRSGDDEAAWQLSCKLVARGDE